MRIFRLAKGGDGWVKEPAPDFPLPDGTGLVKYMMDRLVEDPSHHWLVFSEEEAVALRKIAKDLFPSGGRDTAMILLGCLTDFIGLGYLNPPFLMPVTENRQDLFKEDSTYLLAVAFHHPRR